MTITRKSLEKIGGSYWETDDKTKKRVYFNNINELIDFQFTRYKSSGMISSAKLGGEHISNNKAGAIYRQLQSKFYYDLKSNQFFSGLDENLHNLAVANITRQLGETE
jgi:hypothetical protein